MWRNRKPAVAFENSDKMSVVEINNNGALG